MERREDTRLTWTGVVVGAFFDWFAFQIAVVPSSSNKIIIYGTRRWLPGLRSQIQNGHYL